MLTFKQFETELLMVDILKLEELTGINIFFASSFLKDLMDQQQELQNEYRRFIYDYFDENGNPLNEYTKEDLIELASIENEINTELFKLDIQIRRQEILEGIDLINYIFPDANIEESSDLDYNLIIDFKNDLREATAAKFNVKIPGNENGSDKKKQIIEMIAEAMHFNNISYNEILNMPVHRFSSLMNAITKINYNMQPKKNKKVTKEKLDSMTIG